MNTREWALLTFTILGQLAAGMMLVLMIVRAYVTSKVGVAEADRMTDIPMFMVVPIMGLALLASLLHLNNLVNVVKAVPNLGSSWLSREVVIAVAFVVVAVVYAFLQWRKIGSNSLRNVIGWIGTITGIVLTYAMPMVYMLRTVPVWNTPITVITFCVTALLLGTLGAAAALAVNYFIIQKQDLKASSKRLELLREIVQSTTIAAIILLGVEFLVLPLYMAYLGAASMESLQLMMGTYGTVLVIRLLLVFGGAGVLATYLFRTASSAGKERLMATLVYSAFVMVLVGEVMGRFLFYATNLRVGL